MKDANCEVSGCNKIIPAIKGGTVVVRRMQIGKVTVRVNSHFDGQESLFDLLLASAREGISKSLSNFEGTEKSNLCYNLSGS